MCIRIHADDRKQYKLIAEVMKINIARGITRRVRIKKIRRKEDGKRSQHCYYRL